MPGVEQEGNTPSCGTDGQHPATGYHARPIVPDM
jgi:hypothetical protein